MPGRTTRLLATILLVTSLWPSPAAADTPYLKLTVVASPNPTAPGAEVTLTGTVTPIGGTFASVSVGMSLLALDPLDVCTPAPNCTMDAFHKTVSWTFPTIASPTVVTATSKGPAPTVNFFVQGCTPNDCLVQDGSVKISGPTLSGNITYAPTGVVMPGDVLHFTVQGSTDVGPVTTNVQTKLPAGLGDPTGISAGGIWNPAPARYIDYTADLNLTATYGFDAAATGPVGTDLDVILICWQASTKAFTKTITIHVGPVATPTPIPTLHPTPAATPKPPPPRVTAAPTPDLTSAIPTASELPSASEPTSTSPSSSPSASSLESSSAPSASAAPSTAPPGDRPISLQVVLLAAGAGGIGVAAWAGTLFLRRRRRLF